MSSTPQMDVLYMTVTGHVLAVFTRTSEPPQIESDPTVAIGQDGFHLRGFGNQATLASFGNQEYVIPVSQMTLARIDSDPIQMVSPRLFGVTLPAAVPPALQSLGKAPTFSYAASAFSITVPAPAAGIPYTILVYGPTPLAAPATPIQTLQNTMAVTGLVSGKSYFAAAFLAEQQIAVTAFTV